MILDYYSLSEDPFGVTPDPRYLYFGAGHREAFSSLVYGTESNRGFLALIAKPGMGKTSLLYRYLEGLRGKARTAFVFRTDCDSREFIRHVLLDLGVDAGGKDLPAMHDMLNRLLAEQMIAGRRFVLVIDEAQNLEERVLESVRLLSNFETPWAKLMQIVIAGQPGLAEKLSRPSLAQLRQRISMVIRLNPLTPEETNAYIDHRLWVSGCENPRFFTAGARTLIAEHSEGIPRNINNLCFNAMSLACAVKQNTIDREIITEVLGDLDLDSICTSHLASADQARKAETLVASHSVVPRKKPSSFKSWFTRVAVALVLIPTLGWGFAGTYRHVLAEPRSVSTGQLTATALGSVEGRMVSAGIAWNSDWEKMKDALQRLGRWDRNKSVPAYDSATGLSGSIELQDGRSIPSAHNEEAHSAGRESVSSPVGVAQQ
jgi:general secretion pathway protein A